MLFSELRKKQVINSLNGQSLGQVCDLVLSQDGVCICAFVVPGIPKTFYERLRGAPNILIPIECVQTIGKDVILARIEGYNLLNRKEK